MKLGQKMTSVEKKKLLNGKLMFGAETGFQSHTTNLSI
jgi:hypothetical protein